MVIANFNGVLMDKRFWDDPEVFRPDRFIDAEGKVYVPDNYLPFGYGKLFGYLIFEYFYFYMIHAALRRKNIKLSEIKYIKTQEQFFEFLKMKHNKDNGHDYDYIFVNHLFFIFSRKTQMHGTDISSF